MPDAEEAVAQAVDSAGYGAYQKKLTALAAVLWMADSMEVSLLSFLYACVGSSFNLSSYEADLLVSIVFAGEMVGAVIAGPVADAIGRRPTSLASAFLVATAGLATAAAPNYWMFVLFRSLVGVGVGAFAVPFDLVAEFLPRQNRGARLSTLNVAWAFGAMYATSAAWALDAYSWRALVAACAAPFILVFLIMFWWLDESPKWLATKRRSDELRKVLERIPVAPVEVDAAVAAVGVTSTAERSNLAHLALKPVALGVAVVWLASGCSFYGASLLITRLYARGTGCHFAYGWIFATSTSEVLGIAAVLFFIDRAGRKKTQIVAYSLSALAFVGAAAATETSLLFVSLYMALATQMTGTSTTWVHLPELYPTDVRATAHSAALTLSRITAFCSSYLVDSHLNGTAVSLSLAVISLAPAVAVALLTPETNANKSSDAIAVGLLLEDSTNYLGLETPPHAVDYVSLDATPRAADYFDDSDPV